jgi:transposase-like protein
MSRPEVLGRVERRRRFSTGEKLAILAEASDPDANVSAVARRHGLFPAQLYKWRRLAELGVIGIPGASELPLFVAVQIAAEPKLTVRGSPRRRAGRHIGHLLATREPPRLILAMDDALSSMSKSMQPR